MWLKPIKIEMCILKSDNNCVLSDEFMSDNNMQEGDTTPTMETKCECIVNLKLALQ